MTKFKVGDKVKCINKGACYSTYRDWIKKYARKYKNNWRYDRKITDTQSIYEVKAIHPHENSGKNIYLIQNTTNQEVYIIGKRGIKKEVNNSFAKNDLKVGDRLYFKIGNSEDYAEVISDKNVVFTNGNVIPLSYYNKNLEYIYNPLYNVIRVERTKGFEVVYERKEEILDKVERKYLKGVIRPFRNRVRCIKKRERLGCDFQEFITIFLKDDHIHLPFFKKDTMYKDMKVDKEYTLEELGL